MIGLIVIATLISISIGCLNRTYGINCSQRCGNCLDDAVCDVITGACQSCAPGYIGILCISECNAGYYGSECSQRCDHCVDRQCTNTDGTCLNGTKATAETTHTQNDISTTPFGRNELSSQAATDNGVLWGFSVTTLALMGAGAVIFLLIVIIICYSICKRCCSKSKSRKRRSFRGKYSERSVSFVYKRASNKPRLDPEK